MSTGVKAKPRIEENLADRAVALATELLHAALKNRTRAERRHAERLRELIANPAAKTFAMVLTDRLYRTRDPARAARAVSSIRKRFGSKASLSRLDRWLFGIAGLAAKIWPQPVIAAMRARLRRESAGVILSAEPRALTKYLARRKRSGFRVNLNLLGEAILGEAEAEKRLKALEELLRRPDVDYLSVKISAICSQLNLLGFEHTLKVVKDRLRRLYRVALAGNKLVNLDMEEYRDLELTLAAFCETLDEPEFAALRAGIVLQAYLPDSWRAQQTLTSWATQRVAAGGAPPKLRLVKGANLAMEKVEAELHGWNPAPYATKEETDANFKRMLEFACSAENARVLRVGVGSHNLFDVALALILREENGSAEFVEIEMLEGMANHLARAIAAKGGEPLMYAPVTRDADFGNALAYLIRRLDENTGSENFLHDIFALTPESPAWKRQAERFRSAWAKRHEVSATSRRAALPDRKSEGFANEPDTDWTQPANRERLREELAVTVRPAIPRRESLDVMLERAKKAQLSWENLGAERRGELLQRVADQISEQRMKLIPVLCRDGSKSVPEADTEISEAIDFARYYARTGPPISGLIDRALGIVVVTPPWNFPFAIPAGGVLAALVMGNAVILKPAPETVATGFILAEMLWKAGIPRDVLQVFACEDGEIGRELITDSRVNAVVLTGSYETARMFLDWRPSLRLMAETSGKNAVVVTALADRDHAIKDLVHSAFGHNGQKCSAGSLAILEAEVYDDPAFRKHLRDAAASLPVGPVENLASLVTPLIGKPGETLCRGLTVLEPGEEWLLEPREVGRNLWTPGIRFGVKPGSWFHQTECFGPVLGLMRAQDLEHAIELQNHSVYGLTAGLHSLDEGEMELWLERVKAGNLYVNRAITGAIVQRQPFGGWKRSSIGPGAKAGGPNYTRLFANTEDENPVSLLPAARSYRAAWLNHFSVPHDPTGLGVESNIFRYRPCRGVVLRMNEQDELLEQLALFAAETCGIPLEMSVGTDEPDEAFAARLGELSASAEFLRTVEVPSDVVLRAAYDAGMNWICAPMVADGRVELTRWFREQSIAITRHRNGNILPTRLNVAAAK